MLAAPRQTCVFLSVGWIAAVGLLLTPDTGECFGRCRHRQQCAPQQCAPQLCAPQQSATVQFTPHNLKTAIGPVNLVYPPPSSGPAPLQVNTLPNGDFYLWGFSQANVTVNSITFTNFLTGATLSMNAQPVNPNPTYANSWGYLVTGATLGTEFTITINSSNGSRTWGPYTATSPY
jgi:hypothetical protein